MSATCRETASTRDLPAIRSFRDPAGSVLATQRRVLRLVNAAGMKDANAFLASPSSLRWAGMVVRTRILDGQEKRDLLEDEGIASLYAAISAEDILEHERIPFTSFPYEWPPEMLYEAARLTLELAIDLLSDGLGLKDATPYNVLFRGPEPVFVDLLSIERRQVGDPLWLPYAQFVRTFLLPLLAQRYLDMRLDRILLTSRDGLEPEEIYGWLRSWQKVRPPFLSLVSFPAWLAKRHKQDDAGIYKPRILPDGEKARYILLGLLKQLQRNLHRITPRISVSEWSRYVETNNYTAVECDAKDRFVRQCLAAHSPKAVLDIGCNTGHFSLLAARSGSRVVAIDSDPAAVGALWRKAHSERADVLPLVVNISRPTPSTGWQNLECPSFLERANSAFDMVFMLAVVHHLMVTERISLDKIVDLTADLTSESLVVEFVAPEDPMFQRLTRGREMLYEGLNVSSFEIAFQRRFEIVQSQRLEGMARWLFLMRLKH